MKGIKNDHSIKESQMNTDADFFKGRGCFTIKNAFSGSFKTNKKHATSSTNTTPTSDSDSEAQYKQLIVVNKKQVARRIPIQNIYLYRNRHHNLRKKREKRIFLCNNDKVQEDQEASSDNQTKEEQTKIMLLSRFNREQGLENVNHWPLY